MIVLKADRELNLTFQKLIKMMDVPVEWSGLFYIVGDYLILQGRVRSLFFNFDTKNVVTNIIELNADEKDIVSAEAHPGVRDALNMVLYAFGKWGNIKGLRVEKDYAQLNRLFAQILGEFQVESQYTQEHFRFYKNKIRLTYEDVIEAALADEPQETVLQEEEEPRGLWHKLIWKKAECTFLMRDISAEERRNDRIGNNFYVVGYLCPKCGEKLYMAVYPEGEEFRIETEEGGVRIARVYTCRKCCCMYTPRPQRLLVDGEIYKMDFEKDETAYEDYQELLGRTAGKNVNTNYNEFVDKRDDAQADPGADDSLQDEEEEITQLIELLPDLPEDERFRIINKMEDGFYSDEGVKRLEQALFGEEPPKEPMEQEPGEMKGDGNEKFEEEMEETSGEKNVRPEATGSREAVRHEAAGSREAVRSEATGSREAVRPETSQSKEAVSSKRAGNKEARKTEKTENEIERGTENAKGAESDRLHGKSLHLKKNAETKSVENVRFWRNSVEKTGGAKDTENVSVTDGKGNNPGKAERPASTEEQSSTEEHSSVKKQENDAEKINIGESVRFQNTPEQIFRESDAGSDRPEKKIGFLNAPKEKSPAREQNREELDKLTRIQKLVNHPGHRTRSDLLQLKKQLEAENINPELLKPYIESILDKIRAIDKKRIKKICQNIDEMNFEDICDVTKRIEEGDFLPQLKFDAIKELELRMTKIKTDECELLVKKLKTALDEAGVKKSEKFYFYPARKVWQKKAETKETDVIENAVLSFANGKGKYEYPVLMVDKSRDGSGKEGVLLTPENIYYSAWMASYFIPVMEISSIEATTGLLNRGIYVYQKNGTKSKLPLAVEHQDLEKMAKVLQDFIFYLQERPLSRKESYLAMEKHETICCYRCGYIYKGGGVCPRCGFKQNE